MHEKTMTPRPGAEVPAQSSKVCREEFVEATRILPEVLQEFVESDWLSAERTAQNEYVFATRDIPRIRKAARLYRDFDLTAVGVTIIVDLLNRIEFLEEELQRVRQKY
ncbi:chaperone modulator CbpM [Desulfoplanes sp.]